MIALKNILVATDFSQPSDAALALWSRAGAELQRHPARRARRRQRPSMVYGADAYAVSIPELQQEVEDSARKQLADAAHRQRRAPLQTQTALLTSNAPAVAIVDYASRERIDLIVTGTNGRGGVAHLLMGSVAERVVRTAPCPVLTVRHPEHEFVIPDALVAVARA